LIIEDEAQKEREGHSPAIEAIHYPTHKAAKDIIVDRILRVGERRDEAGVRCHYRVAKGSMAVLTLPEAAQYRFKSVDVGDWREGV
jgi:hypothetical protein